MRIMSLHNGTRRVVSMVIIGYDLDHILVFNLSNLLHKFIRNVEPALCESLDVHGRQNHRITFRDGHEINDRPPLCIRPSIIAKRHILRTPRALNEFQLHLYIRFFILQKSGPQGIVSGRDITRDGLFATYMNAATYVNAMA